MRVPRFTAVITLFAWLFAFGHVSLEHPEILRGVVGCVQHGAEHSGYGMEAARGASHSHEGHGKGHEHGEALGNEVPADGHHHHELGFSQGTRWQNSLEAAVQPAALGALSDCVVLHWVESVLLRSLQAASRFRPSDPPADARASGWLWMAQTARPVRGPSIAG